MHLYVAPSLVCYSFRHRGLDWSWHTIPLPYPDLPGITEDEWRNLGDKNPIVLPPDGWKVLFGCRECGHLDTYDADSVGENVLERQQSGRFHNETNCFSVKLRCARIDCKVPATLHVNLGDGETEKDLLRLLKANFFDGLLPCGHQIMSIPDRYYVDPHRILSRLW